MFHLNHSPSDENFSRRLLDAYAELTELSVVLYINDSEKALYSKHRWPDFCQEIFEIPELKKGCVVSYSKSGKGLHQCHAGLWCYSQPVEVDGNLVGTYVVGHKRIKGRERESESVLNETLSEQKISDEVCNSLRKLLKEVDAVDETLFDKKFFDRLSFIAQIAIREHQHAITFKKEAVHLAHEFLLPIQSIIADAENLFNEAEEKSELKEISKDILQEITILYFIAENIRGSVLENRDGFGYEFHDVEICPIIQDVINLFRKQAGKKNVTINDLIVREGLPVSVIEMSEPHVTQVFFNLIHNAVKYSYTSTKKSERYITVVCKPYKNFYCVEVTNYGVGIKSEEISKGLIYNDGYRGILARDQSRTGSGFGLGRVKEIIEAHNGCIKVESREVGIGPKIDPHKTTVTVCIPFCQPMRSPHGN